jgi:hypothetical protein
MNNSVSDHTFYIFLSSKSNLKKKKGLPDRVQSELAGNRDPGFIGSLFQFRFPKTRNRGTPVPVLDFGQKLGNRIRLTPLLETTSSLFPQATKLVKSLEEGIFRFRSKFSLLPLLRQQCSVFPPVSISSGCLFQI